ncbi:HAMP domain-containing sensor histidine kinase [Nocardiopsis sp. RSe5-2]|uniref:histidine kinase n=1 Tax=Nocardiopsis endophytica TaxID=3018445 RepID=A0ABT4UAC9_9ACTN|nr:HAMP domain-containing sensor histidine kinase [Nocardiopsis endophytica]MDA2813925.1 HAMP domain-containing sensor histidine kinase [Nocardiopsis endophytica]
MGMWRRLRPRSIRGRATAGSLLIVAPPLALALFLAGIGVHHESERVRFDRANAAARQVATRIESQGYEGAVPPTAGVLRIQVVDDDGRVVAASSAMQGRPPLVSARPERGDFLVEETLCPAEEGDGCLSVVGVETDSDPYGPVIVYAAVSYARGASAPLLEVILAGVGALALAAVGWMAWRGAGRALRPVESIRRDLERLSAGDLGRRLRIPTTGDELAELARTGNATLDRLERAMDRQRSFVSDASHELRNPIAGMRTRLEVELADPDPEPGSARGAMEGLLQDVERLQRIVGDLLELARLDADVAAGSTEVDLAGLVLAEVERRVSAVEVGTDLEPGARVRGDRVRLGRVLTNLLANAERHARERILVVVRTEGDTAVMEVHDDGAGIPEADRERVFERFARLAESRRRDPGGSGLGLAISRAVAESGGGTLTAGESPVLGGAVLVMRLPTAGDGAGGRGAAEGESAGAAADRGGPGSTEAEGEDGR